MQIFRELMPMRQQLQTLRSSGRSIALVPTMGALHDGHIALVRRAATLVDAVVVSIFVNPRQFGPTEDLSRYPRQEDADAALLRAAGAAALWAPSVDVMYPAGFETTVKAGPLADRLCGAARPGHFDGVVTVVTKLLNQVQPQVALFGEKDFQQLLILRRCVLDLNLPVSIVGAPIERDDDGLALSSRNAYLSPDERAAAVALPRALQRASDAIAAGAAIAAALDDARSTILAAGFRAIDYLELVDAATLAPLGTPSRDMRLLAAAHIGTTRLIDNIAVNPKAAAA